MLNNFSS